MAPKSKSNPKPLTGDSQRQADAMYIMDNIMELATPITINVTEISARTGVKPNTIIKRFGTLRQRYPGLNIVTTARSAESIPTTPIKTAPSTPVVTTRKKNLSAKVESSSKKVVLKPMSRRTRQSTPDEVEEQSEIESDDEVDEDADGDSPMRETVGTRTANTKRKRSLTNTAARTHCDKKAKIAPSSDDENSMDELASDGYAGDAEKTPAAKNQRITHSHTVDVKGESERDSEDEGTTYSLASEFVSSMPLPPPPSLSSNQRDSGLEAVPEATPVPVTESKQPIPPSNHLAPPTLDVKVNSTIISPISLPPRTTPLSPSLPASLNECRTTTDHALFQNKYDTLPPALPPKMNRILMFGGNPLPTAPLSEDTKNMIRSGKLRNGAKMKIDAMPSAAEKNGKIQGNDDDHEGKRGYEWETC